MKKPVLYYYFGNKEGLYRALVDQSSLLLMRFLGEATVVAGTADRVEARLARLAETLLGLARDNTDPVRFFFAHFFAADADRPACDSQDLERRPPHVIRKLAEEGIETGELFGEAAELERLVIGAIQYSIIKHLRHPEEEPLLPGLGGRIVRAAIAGFGTRRP